MGKLNEIQEQTTQSWGDNSFTTSIKVDTVEFDSAKDSFTFNDPVNVPGLKINGTEIATFDAEDKAKLDSLTTTMQVKGRIDDISDLPDDASVGDVYLVGLSGDGNFEEYVCTEVSGSPATPVWENLGHVKVQSDWNQSNISADNYIKNKPAIKAGQGSNSIIEGDIDTNVAGVFSHAEGYRTDASGNYGSHTEGNETTASGTSSHAEGTIVTASGTSSHAEGFNTTASGSYSHAEGHKTTAKNRSQHAFGEYNELDPSTASSLDRGTYIEIVGKGTDENARSNARTLDWKGNETLAGNLTIGGTITANGQQILPAEPQVQTDWNQNNGEAADYIKNKPAIKAGQGVDSIIEGDIYNNVAGNFSHAEGQGTEASGDYSHAEGQGAKASGPISHAEGAGTTASGNYSHAEGAVTKAIGGWSHAEGYSTTASGDYSHAEGNVSTAGGANSHAEGGSTTASGDYSHAEGYQTQALSYWSHAEGKGTIANHEGQHVFGAFNIADPSLNDPHTRGNYVEIVGKGTKSSARSNARTLDWQGNETLAGNLTIGGASGATLKVENGALKVSFDGGTTWLTVSAS